MLNLYPKFLELHNQCIAECAKLGALYVPTSGFRSPEEQTALYAIGRTTEFGRKPVTNAKAFGSYHNFGLAVDYVRDSNAVRKGVQPSYNQKDYQILAEVAQKLGLEAGFYWKKFPDAPHVQFKLPKNTQLAQLECLYKKGGLPLVFNSLDR